MKKNYFTKIIAVFLAVIMIFSLCGCSKEDDHSGEAKAPYSSSDLEGEDYQAVVKQFEKSGFTNVRAEPMEDLIFGWLASENEVDHVTLDGIENYTSGEWYSEDVEIVVFYHSFEIETEEEKAAREAEEKEEAEQKAAAEAKKKEEAEKKAAEKAKKKAEAEKKAAEEAKKQKEAEAKKKAAEAQKAALEKPIKELKGKNMQEAYSVLNANGFKATLTHEVTQMDFTNEIPSEGESEWPKWIVVDVKNINTTNKTVTLIVNHQDNIARIEAEKKQQQQLEAKLDPSVAWGSVEVYGKNQYPYGFKLHLLTGMLAERPEDDNTWFLKCKCTIENAYGNKMDATCEAKVTGTTDNPVVTYFVVY